MILRAGTQLWTDVRCRNGWRVQSHYELRAHRLLDPQGRVRCRGSLAACEGALDQAEPESVPSDHLVVLLHGLGRTRRSLSRLESTLAQAGLATACLDYPSTRRPIEAHAASVAELLDHTLTPKKLSFVSHSLGGLVIRELLRHQAPWRLALHRILMVAPPNQGASRAAALDKGSVLRAILGPSFGQIAEGFPKTLPVPDVPVSIFAGRVAGSNGDGLVTVEETRLEGMAEHHVVPAIHTFVMNHPDVLRRAVSFLGATPK